MLHVKYCRVNPDPYPLQSRGHTLSEDIHDPGLSGNSAYMNWRPCPVGLLNDIQWTASWDINFNGC
jgi:hypothetical protein